MNEQANPQWLSPQPHNPLPMHPSRHRNSMQPTFFVVWWKLFFLIFLSGGVTKINSTWWNIWHMVVTYVCEFYKDKGHVISHWLMIWLIPLRMFGYLMNQTPKCGNRAPWLISNWDSADKCSMPVWERGWWLTAMIPGIFFLFLSLFFLITLGSVEVMGSSTEEWRSPSAEHTSIYI